MASRHGGVRAPMGGERCLHLALHSLEPLPQPPGIFSRMIGEPGERGIESPEEAALGARAPRPVVTRALDQAVVVDEAAGARYQRHTLRAVLVQGRPALLLKGPAPDRIQRSGVYPDQPLPLEVVPEGSQRCQVLFGHPVAGDRLEEPPRPPGTQAELTELREQVGIAGRPKRLGGELPYGLVMAMLVGGLSGPAGDDDVRLNKANGPGDLADHGVSRPLRDRVGAALAVAEVVEGAEQSLRSVDRASVLALPGAEDPQRLAPIRVEPILTGLSPGGRPVDAAHAEAVREIGEETAVLVVGVRAHLQYRPGHRQRPEPITQLGRVKGSTCLADPPRHLRSSKQVQLPRPLGHRHGESHLNKAMASGWQASP